MTLFFTPEWNLVRAPMTKVPTETNRCFLISAAIPILMTLLPRSCDLSHNLGV